jgi:hypothetical protein
MERVSMTSTFIAGIQPKVKGGFLIVRQSLVSAGGTVWEEKEEVVTPG